MIKVVSLGCKLGNSIDEFLKRGQQFYEEVSRAHIDPKTCLGIDKQERFAGDVTAQGFQFQCLDVTAEGALEALPEAEYYLVWNLLEHLPDAAWVKAVLQTVIHRASKGVWVKSHSFETDSVTGEGRLRQIGLRFAWTEQPSRPCRPTLYDLVNVINDYKKNTGRTSISLKIHPAHRVRATDDPCVLPLAAPPTAKVYALEYGSKPEMNLEPNLVAQWNLIIKT